MSFPPSAWALVIEDGRDQIALWSDVCVGAGLNVMTAASGLQGYRRARNTQPALILLDETLPDMDGWALCQLLKTDDRTKTIPIVILLAHDEPEGAHRAREARCAAHLAKGSSPAELVGMLRKVLGEQQAS